MPNSPRILLVEALGTFLLVLFGLGAVHAAVLTGAQSGLWQVAVVWGLAVMFAIYTCGGVSGAHVNPAMTVAFAVWGRFSWGKVAPYILAQMLGAMVAAAVLFYVFGPNLEARERQKQVARGSTGSIVTAMCYGEYYPSPGGLSTNEEPWTDSAWHEHRKLVSTAQAFISEVVATAILAFVVFAVTHPRNASAPPNYLAPVFIGLTVAALISVFAPLTQACFNPARDFGPRLFAYLAGWGSAAIPGPNGHGFFTVYIAAPTIGAVIGGGVHDLLCKPAYLPAEELSPAADAKSAA